MEKILSNDFALNAQIAGKVLITGIQMVEGVLYQSMDAAGNLAPDWTNAGPKWKAAVKDTNGTVRKSLPNNGSGTDYEKLYWNDQLVTFAGTGLSNAVGTAFPAGTFKRTTDTDGTYIYQIMKNFFDQSSNADSDIFRIEGKIEIAGGNFQDFVTPDQPVTLVRYSTGGTPYVVLINNVHNITTQGGTGYMDAFLYDVATMTVVQNATPEKWFNVDGTGAETECTAAGGYTISGNRLTVPASEVNGYDNFCARFKVGNEYYRGYSPLRDETDNIYASYEIVGDVKGTEVEEGGTARVKIRVVDKDGNNLSSWGPLTLVPSLVLKGNDGTTITPATYSGTADALANTNTAVSNISYKGEAWKGTLAVPHDKLISECGGRLQGWIGFDPLTT